MCFYHMKNFKKAFTLIEMLIVVVIIGILAAALIPRLQSVQGRARDTKRKADLSQIGSALSVYKSDVGSFTALSGTTTSGLTTTLVTNGSYITAIPTDSDASTWNANSTTPINGGYYAFATLARNGSTGNAFILGARTETDGTSSNWVYASATSASGGAIIANTNATVYESAICQRVAASAGGTDAIVAGGVCTANRSNNTLRYIYVQ